MIRAAVAALGLSLLLNGSGAFAQEELPEAIPQETAPRPVAILPAPPAGSFGVWRGPVATADYPLPKGFESFYVKQEWNRAVTENPVFAFTMVGGGVATWEGTRDKKTGVADYSTTYLRYRYHRAGGFDPEPTGIQSSGKTGVDAEVPTATMIALDPAKDYFLASRQNGEKKKEYTSLCLSRPGDTGIIVTIPRIPSAELPLALLEFRGGTAVRYLAQSKTGVAVMELKPDGQREDLAPVVTPTVAKIVPVPVRLLPVSAACVGEFAGDRKQIVAALGSVANGPVAFAGLRSKSLLPDTEEEFAPGLIAAWRVPGRALPFLVTARNTGAEEGTDTPEGRVILSLWHAGEGRWMSVWESGPLGKKIIGVASAEITAGVTKLMVLCEDADGTSRLACLAPILSSDAPQKAP